MMRLWDSSGMHSIELKERVTRHAAMWISNKCILIRDYIPFRRTGDLQPDVRRLLRRRALQCCQVAGDRHSGKRLRHEPGALRARL